MGTGNSVITRKVKKLLRILFWRLKCAAIRVDVPSELFNGVNEHLRQSGSISGMVEGFRVGAQLRGGASPGMGALQPLVDAATPQGAVGSIHAGSLHLGSRVPRRAETPIETLTVGSRRKSGTSADVTHQTC